MEWIIKYSLSFVHTNLFYFLWGKLDLSNRKDLGYEKRFEKKIYYKKKMKI